MTKKERNKLLQEAIERLNDAQAILQDVFDDEEESLGNWPESLQETDRYYHAEERKDRIEEALTNVEELGYSIQETIDEEF